MYFIIVLALPSAKRSSFSLQSSAPELFISLSSISLLSLCSNFPKSKPLKNFFMAEGCSFLFPGDDLFLRICFITKLKGELFGMSSSCLSWQLHMSSFRGSADTESISFRIVYSCLLSFTAADAVRISYHSLSANIKKALFSRPDSELPLQKEQVILSINTADLVTPVLSGITLGCLVSANKTLRPPHLATKRWRANSASPTTESPCLVHNLVATLKKQGWDVPVVRGCQVKFYTKVILLAKGQSSS